MQTQMRAATMRDVIAAVAELPDGRLQEAYEFLFRLAESDDPNFSDEGISPAELARRDAIDIALARQSEKESAGEPTVSLDDLMRELDGKAMLRAA